jgi:hypothetical protein
MSGATACTSARHPGRNRLPRARLPTSSSRISPLTNDWRPPCIRKVLQAHPHPLLQDPRQVFLVEPDRLDSAGTSR